MATRRNIIFGAGGHARVIASLLSSGRDSGAGPTLFVTQDGRDGTLVEEEFFARIDSYREDRVYLGIGDNGVRKSLFEKLVSRGVRPANCVAPNAFVAADVRLGFGVTLCPGTVVMSGAVVGDNVIINTLSSVDHDCRIGNHSQLTAGVTLGGTVVVGESCFFGVRSAVTPNLTIGDGTLVMAGSLVTKNFPSQVVVGGYPAAIIKRVE